MQELLSVVNQVKAALWGVPLIVLILGVGVYLTISLRGIQFRYLWKVFRLFRAHEKDDASGDISPFQSIMTAMASAVGTGSIVGVATAISSGGLGAVFWLWVTSFISMAVKFSEALLAVKYRVPDGRGEMSGGPMYYIEQGLGWRWLAILFAVFACIAAIGTGNLVQVNSIAEAIQNVYQFDSLNIGIALSILTAVVLFGGIKSIGRVVGWLVPVMATFYIIGGAIVLFNYRAQLPEAISLIISSAFTGQAAIGGFLGSTMMMAIQMGVARSLFTSEAGFGISSIAAAAAKTNSSGRQAMMSTVITLVSTAIICTITALVIAITGVMGKLDADGKLINGASLAIQAFTAAIPAGKFFVIIGLVLFAYSTVIAWAYYGEKCFEYLFGEKSVMIYRIIYTVLVIPGSIFALELVWSVADLFNACMVVPNMVALLMLSGVIQKETKEFVESEKAFLDPKYAKERAIDAK